MSTAPLAETLAEHTTSLRVVFLILFFSLTEEARQFYLVPHRQQQIPREKRERAINSFLVCIIFFFARPLAGFYFSLLFRTFCKN